MQGKELAFPWIPLVESGLFNGLQRIQIRKSHGPGFLQFVSAIAPCPRSQAPLATRINRASNNNIAHILTFEKTMCAIEAMVYVSAHSAWVALVARSRQRRSDQAAAAQDRRLHFVGRIIQGGTQSGRSQAARVLWATCVGLNTTELIALRRLNSRESHRFVTRITACRENSR